MTTASTPLVAVATFEMPMYRPDDALGMMSVISAQSTARKLPSADAHEDRPADEDRDRDGARAPQIVMPMPRDQARRVDHGLAADAVGDLRRRDGRDRPCTIATMTVAAKMQARRVRSLVDDP